MLDRYMMASIDSLDDIDLRKLYRWIGDRIQPSVTYQQKPTKCRCNKCKEGGKGHGSYWYAYFTYKGKTHCIYIGKEKREIKPLEELEKKKIRMGGNK